jgi:hypothetical protein
MKRIALIVGAVAVLSLGYCVFLSNYSHRYRLTIEVQTPDGIKTASSVIQASATSTTPILGTGLSTTFKGDATFLDLGRGKNVVAVLARGDEAGQMAAPVILAMEAFGVRNCTTYDMCDWQAMQSMTGTRNLPDNLLPTLVTFSDPNNPRTAEVIKPNEFETVFGPGYRFIGARIEMTRDPVTRNIEKILPWLKGFKGVTGGEFDLTWQHPGHNLYANHFTR